MKIKLKDNSEIELQENFVNEYELWKSGKQTSKYTMETLKLKRGKFYMFVKEYEKQVNICF